jgi:hypothetical protein
LRRSFATAYDSVNSGPEQSGTAASLTGRRLLCLAWTPTILLFIGSLPLIDYRVVIGLKLVIAALTTALLLWGWAAERRGGAPRHRTLRAAALGALGVVALAGWWNFGQFHPNGVYVHYHEFFHYYVGSKYFPELGYTGLYDCVAAADVEQGFGRQAATRWIRNLETNELHFGSPAVLNPDLCRARFTPERWTAFSHDVRWFRDHVPAKKWSELAGDHGYNATPVWTIAGHLLSNTGPATWRQIRLLAFIDPVLLLLMWALVWWAFGWEVACVAACWWGTNYPARYTYIGGAFLREDWLVLAVAAICFAKRERWYLSGFALAWSALLRIFPGFIVVGLLAKILLDSWRARRLIVAPSQWRFAGGAALALVLWLPLSITVGAGEHGGPSVWSSFAQNSRKHLATPLTNNVGLPMVVSFGSSARTAQIGPYWIDAPGDVWVTARSRLFNQRLWLYVALAAVFAVALARAVRGRDDWIALTLGVGAIPVLTNVTCYYYGILLAYAFLWPRNRSVGIGLLFLSVITCITPALLEADDDRYTVISLAILVFVAMTTLLYNRTFRITPVPAPIHDGELSPGIRIAE